MTFRYEFSKNILKIFSFGRPPPEPTMLGNLVSYDSSSADGSDSGSEKADSRRNSPGSPSAPAEALKEPDAPVGRRSYSTTPHDSPAGECRALCRVACVGGSDDGDERLLAGALLSLASGGEVSNSATPSRDSDGDMEVVAERVQLPPSPPRACDPGLEVSAAPASVQLL